MMTKLYLYCFAFCAMLSACMVGGVVAQTNYYGDGVSGNIVQVIDEMQKGNPVVHSVFEQKVRWATEGKLTWFNTVDDKGNIVRNRIADGAWVLVLAISPYMQWLIFFGMSLSVILIIYNGFIITTSPGDDKIKSAKDNIKNILIGVLVLGGFYFILRLVSGLLLNLIGG